MPMALIYFVTKACNCACEHCFYWQSLNKPRDKELTLDEARKIASKAGRLLYLRLSGGEPFIRNDLLDIVEAFEKECRPSYIGIPTNGFFVDKIVDFAKKTAALNTRIEIGISIDDLGPRHDQIRNCPGLFEKAMETFEALKEVKKNSKNLGVGFIVTAMKSNQQRLREIFETLSRLQPDGIACNIVRDNIKSAKEKEIDLGLVYQFAKICDEYNEGVIQVRKTFFDRMRHIKTLQAHRIREEIIKTNQFQIPCVAGDKIAVIYSEGEVSPCETLDYQIGNIRDFNYDIRRLLKSERGRRIRKKIREEKCFCTHECFATANIIFSKRQLFKIFIKSLFSR
jgi:radical SAM protein with 4Fe4S-binding SPASM domain